MLVMNWRVSLMEMIRRTIVLLCCFGFLALGADLDMDGVPDESDVCKHTPFLDEVNEKGCSINRLLLPEEKENDSLDLILGYSKINDEESLNRGKENSVHAEINYYNDNWIYRLGTSYFENRGKKEMEDTLIGVKKRFILTNDLKLTTGMTIKLPTYNFQGNKTDLTFSTALNYYPLEKWAFYVGGYYTVVNDDDYIEVEDDDDDDDESPEIVSLNNSSTFYVGTGYFFSKKLYANISYGYLASKFKAVESIETVRSTIFYQVNNQWFTTFSYSRELNTEDLNKNFRFNLGYTLW